MSIWQFRFKGKLEILQKYISVHNNYQFFHNTFNKISQNDLYSIEVQNLKISIANILYTNCTTISLTTYLYV